MSPRETELERWTAAAPHWVGNATIIASMTGPVTQALVGHLTPEAGEWILDLACGTGDPTSTLAGRVGSSGHIVALDPIAEMTEATRAATSPERVTVVRARAEGLPFVSACFDGVTCRFGAMFLQPALEAGRQMQRVLRPGGRAVLAVWGARQSNPYFTAVHAALDELGAPRVESDPDQPTVFEFAEPGSLPALMRSAGFARCEEFQLPFTMRVPDCTPTGFLDRQAHFSPVIAKRLEALPAELLESARQVLAGSLAAHADQGDLALPALALIVRATR